MSVDNERSVELNEEGRLLHAARGVALLPGRGWVSDDTATTIGVTEGADNAWGACKLLLWRQRKGRWVTG